MLPEQIDDRNIYLQNGNGIIRVTSHYDTMAAKYNIHIETDASWYWQLEETEKEAKEDNEVREDRKSSLALSLCWQLEEKKQENRKRRGDQLPHNTGSACAFLWKTKQFGNNFDYMWTEILKITVAAIVGVFSLCCLLLWQNKRNVNSTNSKYYE